MSFLKQGRNTCVTATPKIARTLQIPSLVTELLGYVGCLYVGEIDLLSPRLAQRQQPAVARL
jgi:hypothetical protein